MKTESRAVFAITAFRAFAAFHRYEFGFAIITSTLLRNVVLMFVIGRYELAPRGAKFILFSRKLATANFTAFFHKVSQIWVAKCSKRIS